MSRRTAFPGQARPSAGMLVLLRRAVLILGASALGYGTGALGCASRPSSRSPSKSPGMAACGNPCADLGCPAGFQCTWNEQCQRRCQPEPLSPALRL